jgi:hypothetical protein
MRNWIFSNQSVSIIFGGVASAFLLFGPDLQAAQDVVQVSCKPTYVRPAEHPVVTGEALENSVRFQRLVSQWHDERGVTSSIEEMCTRPAYLSIMALGQGALPLILRQLRSEGDNPDHWFFALHHITKGANPVPDEDRGDIAKMSAAWLRWAEHEGDAG